MNEKSAAIIVSAGQGVRFGGLKQLEMLDGLRVIDRALAVARQVAEIVICVKVPGVDFGSLDADLVVDGGASRSESVRAGISVLPDHVEYVYVHDAARPLASKDLYTRVADCLKAGAQAVVPVIPIQDTVKEVIGNTVVATLDRSRLFAVQTPQGFQRKILELAHRNQGEATDDSALVEELGVSVEAILGEADNFKITSEADLVRAGLVQRTQRV